MKVELLTEEKEAATAKYKEYLQASKTSRDKTIHELKKVYNHIRKGKMVIDIFKVIPGGGVREGHQPNLAICQATAKKVLCRYSRNGDILFRDASTWKMKRFDIRLDKAMPTWEEGRWSVDLEAPVPIIPPKFRPGKLTPDYYILWEVDTWTMAPSRDPYLLRRLTSNLFLVCAAWDLTDIEMAVMAGRIS
jgi:hypothetical protein